ncbi:MAG TPA: branched-chain amino acid ABC transporter substrate-binding protein [Candidatus Dormibacteraeota bacterium]|nr:branched-chain amino acid ABC transporter substrate-binding protein [Candidatus Dormibacteraeota bacterium]
MLSKLRRTPALVAAACIVFASACSSAAPAKVIRIGVELPLSGAEGRAGTPVLNGVRFYVHQHPTIGGFTVEVVTRDDAVNGVHNAAQGARNITSLAADSLVVGVVGPFDSSVARAEIPVANLAHLAIVSPGVSSRCLTKEPFLPAGLSPAHTEISCKTAGLPTPSELRPTGKNNFFRLATTDDLQGPAAADYGYKDLKLRRVAVLSDHEAYGQALAAGFATRFTNLGGSVVSHLDFDPSGNLDLTAFMRHAKDDGAQAIYYGGVTANHGCTLRAQMASTFSAGETSAFLGGDGIAQDPQCVRNAGGNAVGMFATVPAVAAGSVMAAQPLIKAFKAQYPQGSDYGAYTASAYDSTGVLYAAIGHAINSAGGKSPSRDSVIKELAATTAFAGATGTFGFDSAGDTSMRTLSVFESKSADPAQPWTWVTSVDYTTALPY